MRIMNAYCGAGGNRKLWGDEHEIVAIELNPEIAKIYQDNFPNDKVIIDDAHEYLLKHFKEFNFIWSSPPCPTHSRINTDGNQKPRYPEMQLYQEIIFLGNNWYKGNWVVENVIPYYKPLIPYRAKIDRHLFWSNFHIYNINVESEKAIAYQTGTNGRYGFNLKGVQAKIDKRKTLRNLVNPEIGLHILNCARNHFEPLQEGLFG